MEQLQQDSQVFPDLRIDETAKRHIVTIASWAMLAVVTAVIGYVLSIVEVLTAGDEPAVREEGFNFGASLSLGKTSLFGAIVTICIGLLINYFLYTFASMARSLGKVPDQEKLTNSFRSLKIYFAILTVLLILMLLLVLLAVLASI